MLRPSAVLLLLLLSTGCRPPSGSHPPGSGGGQPALTTVQEADARIKELKDSLDWAARERERLVVEARQSQCRRVALILGLLAAGCVVVAWFLPLFRWKVMALAAVCIGMIPAVLFVAKLAAYWELIGLGFLLLALLAVIVWWYRDHRTLSQVTLAVEDAKLTAAEWWEKVKPCFKDRIDGGVRPWIQGVVKRAKAAPP